MTDQVKQNFLFVLNPISGGTDKQLIRAFIEERSEAENIGWHIYETTGNDDESKIENLAAKYNPQLVIAVGGDGTLMMLARLFRGRSQELGLIPSGSANGMAAELGIPEVKGLTENAQLENLALCWEILLHKKARPLDLVKVNDHYSMHLADAGFNARIVHEFEKSGQRGLMAYARQFISEFTDKQKFGYSITADNRKVSGEAYMVAIANARRYGTGAVINPEGRPDDGRVELCIVKDLNLMLLLDAATSIINEDPDYDPKALDVISCKKASIGFDTQEVWQVDGEPAGETDAIDVEVVSGAVKMRY